MNVLVTGGTGFVGHAVIRRLSAGGHSVRALVRDPRSARARELEQVNARQRTSGSTASIQIVPGEVISGAGLEQAIQGVDAVVHLVGIISEFGNNTFENSHTIATANVVKAAQKGRVRRYVQMSALGTRAGARSRYHRTKWEAEEIVRQSGLDWTIFRPSLIYGPQDQFVNLYAQIIRFSPVVPLMGRRTTQFQPVQVEVVADAFVKSLSEPRAFRREFELGGPEKMTLRQIVESILQVMGRKRLLLQVPGALARGQAAMLEVLYPGLLRRAPPLNRDQLLMLQEDNTTNETAAGTLFGLNQRRFAEAVREYLG